MSTEAAVCISCKAPKTALFCGLCRGAVCKRCAQLVDEGSFSFLEEVPAELRHPAYCVPCFNGTVAPAQDDYRRTMARARAVFVFVKAKGEETRLMKRSEKPLRVVDCDDRDETFLRLAFFAAKAGFNALVDVDVTARKVRHFGYQTSKWTGSGVPTRVDGEKLEREQARRRYLPIRPSPT